MSFLDGVKEHLTIFSQSRGVSAKDVHVRITLADGTHLIVQGLQAEGPAGTFQWGMISGFASESVDALLIREDHILTVEFQLRPMLKSPAGLQAEER